VNRFLLVVTLGVAGCSCSPPVLVDAGGDAGADAPEAPRILDLVVADVANCVLLRGGQIECWGRGLPDGVTELSGGVDQVVVGTSEVCVRRGPTVECRGAPRAPSNPLLEPPSADFVDIGANNDRACGRTSARSLLCWGISPLDPLVPNVDELRVGSQGGVCVRNGMSGACWFSGETTPRALLGEIAHVARPNLWGRCALDTAGEVVCDPTCAFATTEPSLCPSDDWTTAVGTGPGGEFVQLDLPYLGFFACGLRATGALECWGLDYEGRPGASHPSLRELEPAGLTFRDFGIGGGHVCGVTTDDRVVCWGWVPEPVDVPAELR